MESEIIPSTWTEYGFLLRKSYDSGLQWDLAGIRNVAGATLSVRAVTKLARLALINIGEYAAIGTAPDGKP